MLHSRKDVSSSKWRGILNRVDLASAEFYLAGIDDACNYLNCGIEVFGGLSTDVPIEEHQRHSPDYVYAAMVNQILEKLQLELIFSNRLETIINDKRLNETMS